MDGRTFDTMTRHLVAAQSRRQTIKALIGGTLGVGLGAVGLRGAARAQLTEESTHGACRVLLERCNENRDCCNPDKQNCNRVSRQCEDDAIRGEDRCCLERGQPCANSCECCRGLRCNPNTNTCRRT